MELYSELERDTVVYIAEFNDGITKVGVSQSPNQRKNSLTIDRRNRLGDHKARVKIFLMTAPMDGDTARLIEKKILEHFEGYRINGSEYLTLKFWKLFDYVRSLPPTEVDESDQIPVIYIKKGVNRKVADNSRALDLLRDYVSVNRPKFYHEITPPDGSTLKPLKLYGFIYADGAVAFFPHILRRILEDEFKFANANKLFNEWRELGIIRCSKNRGFYRRLRDLRDSDKLVDAVYFNPGTVIDDMTTTLFN